MTSGMFGIEVRGGEVGYRGPSGRIGMGGALANPGRCPGLNNPGLSARQSHGNRVRDGAAVGDRCRDFVPILIAAFQAASDGRRCEPRALPWVGVPPALRCDLKRPAYALTRTRRTTLPRPLPSTHL